MNGRTKNASPIRKKAGMVMPKKKTRPRPRPAPKVREKGLPHDSYQGLPPNMRVALADESTLWIPRRAVLKALRDYLDTYGVDFITFAPGDDRGRLLVTLEEPTDVK